MIYVKALLLIALLFLAITFGIQNSGSMTLRYYFGLASIPLPLYLVLYVAVILGVVAGLLLDVYARVTLRGRLRKLEKTNASLREDLEKMKSEGDKETTEDESAGPVRPEISQMQSLPSSTPVSNDEDGSNTPTESSTAAPDQD
jgi:uncharacterized integral membrane protein